MNKTDFERLILIKLDALAEDLEREKQLRQDFFEKFDELAKIVEELVKQNVDKNKSYLEL